MLIVVIVKNKNINFEPFAKADLTLLITFYTIVIIV